MWLFKCNLSLYFLTFPLLGFEVNSFDLNLAYHLGTRVCESKDQVLLHMAMLSASLLGHINC